MKNIYTYISISIISLVLAAACPFLMTAADAPIREAGTYLPLVMGAVFTWSSAKALFMARNREKNSANARSAA